MRFLAFWFGTVLSYQNYLHEIRTILELIISGSTDHYSREQS